MIARLKKVLCYSNAGMYLRIVQYFMRTGKTNMTTVATNVITRVITVITVVVIIIPLTQGGGTL